MLGHRYGQTIAWRITHILLAAALFVSSNVHGQHSRGLDDVCEDYNTTLCAAATCPNILCPVACGVCTPVEELSGGTLEATSKVPTTHEELELGDDTTGDSLIVDTLGVEFVFWSDTDRCKNIEIQRAPRFALGGPGHSLEDCKAGCATQSEMDCVAFTYSHDGFCHMFRNCSVTDQIGSFMSYARILAPTTTAMKSTTQVSSTVRQETTEEMELLTSKLQDVSCQ